MAMTSAKPLPSQETLNALLRYEPDTGKLFWRRRTPEMFSGRGRGGAVGMCNRFNAQWAGKEALSAKSNSSHCTGLLLQTPQMAHRVIWKMVTGEEPAGIWHLNGDGTDNRWSNLKAHHKGQTPKRPVGMRRSRKPGIWWNGECQRWVAMLGEEFLGTFDTIDAAVDARLGAQEARQTERTVANPTGEAGQGECDLRIGAQ